VLDDFKDNMERPISAILIVNTTANTAGASIAGAMAADLFGGSALVWFSVFFTFSVLIFSEIIPKIVGVVYVRPIARAVALPWNFTVRLLYPVIWVIEHVSTWIKPNQQVFSAPEEEVVQLARISADEGSISAQEAALVTNALALNEVTARDVMTPRTVVYRLPETLTLREIAGRVEGWQFSRIPIHDPEDSEQWTGVVRASDVLINLARDRFDVTLAELGRPLHFVPGAMEGHTLLNQFLAKRTHLFGVVDEFGGMAGVVTLEDVVEELIGHEIIDEVDRVVDLQEAARGRQIVPRQERDSAG